MATNLIVTTATVLSKISSVMEVLIVMMKVMNLIAQVLFSSKFFVEEKIDENVYWICLSIFEEK